MSYRCERCGESAGNLYSRTGVDEHGNKRIINLCRDCYSVTENVSWTSVSDGGMVYLQNSIPENKTENSQCDFCGKKGVTAVTTYIDSDNEKKTANLCETCANDLKNKNPAPNNIYQSSGSGWTGFFKVINIICAMVITIIGFVIGGIIADATSYDSADVVFGSFLGGIVGLIVGLISIALSMVIAEISDTLKDIRDELKK